MPVQEGLARAPSGRLLTIEQVQKLRLLDLQAARALTVAITGRSEPLKDDARLPEQRDQGPKT